MANHRLMVARRNHSYSYQCEKCRDTGIVYLNGKFAIVVPCDCDRGKQIEVQVDQLQTDLQTCRLLSREANLKRTPKKALRENDLR